MALKIQISETQSFLFKVGKCGYNDDDGDDDGDDGGIHLEFL